MLDLPKRVSSLKYQDGELIIDDQKHVAVQNLSLQDTMQIAQIGSLKAFYSKNLALSDELIAPFKSLEKIVNFGAEGANLTDKSWEVFAAMPALEYLWLSGNSAIAGHGIEALGGTKIRVLCLNNTALDDAALAKIAQIPTITHVHINATSVSFEGLLAVAGNKKLKINAGAKFSSEQMREFEDTQRNLAKKGGAADEASLKAASASLTRFFSEMTRWERGANRKSNDENLRELGEIFAKYVCEKPRAGYRPLCVSYSGMGGTYKSCEIAGSERVSKTQLILYANSRSGFESRYKFQMKCAGGEWKIAQAWMFLDGWERTGL